MDGHGDRRERTVYVWMLERTVNDDQIYKIFSSIGPIEKLIFKTNVDGSPQHALVVYRYVDSVLQAMSSLQGAELNGRPIALRPLRESSHCSYIPMHHPRMHPNIYTSSSETSHYHQQYPRAAAEPPARSSPPPPASAPAQATAAPRRATTAPPMTSLRYRRQPPPPINTKITHERVRPSGPMWGDSPLVLSGTAIWSPVHPPTPRYSTEVSQASNYSCECDTSELLSRMKISSPKSHLPSLLDFDLTPPPSPLAFSFDVVHNNNCNRGKEGGPCRAPSRSADVSSPIDGGSFFNFNSPTYFSAARKAFFDWPAMSSPTATCGQSHRQTFGKGPSSSQQSPSLAPPQHYSCMGIGALGSLAPAPPSPFLPTGSNSAGLPPPPSPLSSPAFFFPNELTAGAVHSLFPFASSPRADLAPGGSSRGNGISKNHSYFPPPTPPASAPPPRRSALIDASIPIPQAFIWG